MVRILGNGDENSIPPDFDPLRDLGMPLPVDTAHLDPDQEAHLELTVACLNRGLSHVNEIAQRLNKSADRLTAEEGLKGEELLAKLMEDPVLHEMEPIRRIIGGLERGALVPLTIAKVSGKPTIEALTDIVAQVGNFMFWGGVEYGKHLSLGVTKEDPGANKEEGDPADGSPGA